MTLSSFCGVPLAVISLAGVLTAPLGAQRAFEVGGPGSSFFSFSSASVGGSFLGVGVAEVSPARARELKLREEYGVEITRLQDDSPATKAGLKAGDVILEYNGQKVEGMEQFGRLVRETPAGRTVKMVLSRNGAAQTLQATLEKSKSHAFLEHNGDFRFEMPDLPMADMPRIFTAWSSSALGVEAESLGRQLSEYFGVKDGVLVRSVVKGSAADLAGIKAGDVITKVDQTMVATPGELSNAVRLSRSKKSFPILLTREHHETAVTVTMEEDRSGREVLPRTRVVRGGSTKM